MPGDGGTPDDAADLDAAGPAPVAVLGKSRPGDLGHRRPLPIGVVDGHPGLVGDRGDGGGQALLHPGADGEAHAPAPAGGDHVGLVEARVGPQHDLGRPGPLQAGQALGHEAGGPRAVVGPPTPQTGMDHLALGRRRHDRVIAPPPRPHDLGGPFFHEAVGLTERGVDVDHAGPAAPSVGPRPFEEGAGHGVDLAHVADGDGSQEAPDGRRGDRPVAEDDGTRPGPQEVHVIDAVGSGHHGVDDAERFVGGVRPMAVEPQPLSDELAQAPRLAQAGHQQEPGVVHQVGLVEDHRQPVAGARRSHRKGALLSRSLGRCGKPPFFLVEGHFPRMPTPISPGNGHPSRWIRAEPAGPASAEPIRRYGPRRCPSPTRTWPGCGRPPTSSP